MTQALRLMNESESPALYMRSPDGCVFTREPQPPGPEPWGTPMPDYVDPLSYPDEVYYRGMVNAIKEGNLIFFIGAGANLCGRMFGYWQGGPYTPSDGELAAHLSGIRPLTYNLRDLVRVSQYIALEDTKVLNSELHSVFTRPFLTTSLHKFLATRPGVLKDTGCAQCHQLIVTTNYDSVLERTFDAENEPYDLVCYITGG